MLTQSKDEFSFRLNDQLKFFKIELSDIEKILNEQAEVATFITKFILSAIRSIRSFKSSSESKAVLLESISQINEISFARSIFLKSLIKFKKGIELISELESAQEKISETEKVLYGLKNEIKSSLQTLKVAYHNAIEELPYHERSI